MCGSIILDGRLVGLTVALYGIGKRLNCLLAGPDLGGKFKSLMLVAGLHGRRVIEGVDLLKVARW